MPPRPGSLGLLGISIYWKEYRSEQSTLCSGLKGATYAEKLSELGLLSLQDRRTRADMILVWKILHNKIHADESVFFTRLNTVSTRETRATASGYNLVIPRSNLETRKNFFTNRTPKIWNDLPDSIKTAESLNSFKIGYDTWNNSRHLH